MTTETKTEPCRGCGEPLYEVPGREGPLAYLHAATDEPECPAPQVIDEPDTQSHYHVYAVQDWGGSQEYWRYETGKLDYDQAEIHAMLMVVIDSANRGIDLAGEWQWADELRGYASTNISPGWEAIWITPCIDFAAECDPHNTSKLGEPWWHWRGVIDLNSPF